MLAACKHLYYWNILRYALEDYLKLVWFFFTNWVSNENFTDLENGMTQIFPHHVKTLPSKCLLCQKILISLSVKVNFKPVKFCTIRPCQTWIGLLRGWAASCCQDFQRNNIRNFFYSHNGHKALYNPTFPAHHQEQWISLAKKQ